MYKRYLFIAGLILFSSIMLAQTRATDFNLNDCDGNPHHLFGKVNEGKVVVLAWVMPCASCITPTKRAYDMFLSIDSLHPSKVLFYMIDDFANTTCSNLKTWGTTNIGDKISAYFSNAAINMYDYGTPGMPKIAVVGSPDYKIYYNLNATSSSTLPGFREAVLDAIALASNHNIEYTATPILSVYPNPARNEVLIRYSFPRPMKLSVEVFSIFGQRMLQKDVQIEQTGECHIPIQLDFLNEGVYLLKLNGETVRFIFQK